MAILCRPRRQWSGDAPDALGDLLRFEDAFPVVLHEHRLAEFDRLVAGVGEGAFPHPAAREITYVEPESGRLVGVGLCDETPRAWSAIYFFYDPAWATKSIGTANVVTQIEIARRRGIPYVYLGYQVEGCQSLAYKASFRPQEHLIGLPEPDETPADGAVVKLKNMKTLQVRSFITQKDGRYAFQNLSTNVDYEVKSDFKDLTSDTRTLSIFDSRYEPIINLKLEPSKDKDKQDKKSE